MFPAVGTVSRKRLGTPRAGVVPARRFPPNSIGLGNGYRPGGGLAGTTNTRLFPGKPGRCAWAARNHFLNVMKEAMRK